MMKSTRETHIEGRDFGVSKGGATVRLWRLAHPSGLEVEVSERGATLISLKTPDREGQLGDILVGPKTLDACEADPFYMGVLVGRVANRIGQGRFTIDGMAYQVDCNRRGYHLHGGQAGFHQAIWSSQVEESADGRRLAFRHVSPHGEGGYPGRLAVTVRLSLDANTLGAEYEWQTDAPSVVNLTHHPYFNLSAGRAVTTAGHQVEIAADQITELNADYIPTGQILNVTGTRYDLRAGLALPESLDWVADGFDQNYVLRTPESGIPAARVFDPLSGRQLELFTDRPGLQFYTGQYLAKVAASGLDFAPGGGLCLESQAFPDAVNHPEFPSTIARPGRLYRSRTFWRFDIAA